MVVSNNENHEIVAQYSQFKEEFGVTKKAVERLEKVVDNLRSDFVSFRDETRDLLKILQINQQEVLQVLQLNHPPIVNSMASATLTIPQVPPVVVQQHD